MKRFLSIIGIFSLFLTTNHVLSQGTFNYQLKVYDTKGQAKSNLEVVLIETATFQRKAFRTDAGGNLKFTLNEGSEWVMNIGEMRNYAKFNIPPNSEGSGSATATYEVKRWEQENQPPVDRSRLQLKEISQNIPNKTYPPDGETILQVDVAQNNGTAWRNLEVKLTCYKLGTSFIGRTDANGIARFKVPVSNVYQVDLDGEDDFSFIDLDSRSMTKTITLTYEKLNFSETKDAEGNTIQRFTVEPKPISNRVMVTLSIFGGPTGGANEEVYLDMTYSNTRYKGKTDGEGKVIFMLPKKRSYVVSFPFHKNAGVLDLTGFRGIGYMNNTVTYQPDPRLEHPEDYLPTLKEVKSYDINTLLKTNYPDTPGDDLVNVHVKWGNNKINSGSYEALLELGFSVKKPVNKEKISKPLNLCFVLDKSGSMAGENFDLLKVAMAEFIQKLRPTDKISLVFFDSQAVTAFPQGNANQKVLTDILSAAQAGGGTAIYEGLKMGFEEINKTYNSSTVNRLILLTDGYGSRPIEELLELSKKYFEKGIAVSTIGVGIDCNQPLLELLSKYSGGFEHQVMEPEGITEALNAEFESLMYPLASNLIVKVKYNDRLIYKTLYGVPESKNTNKTVEFELKQVYSTLNRMALLKFKIDQPSTDFDQNKITIEVSYFDEVKQVPVKIVKETHLDWSEESDIEIVHDQHLKEIYSLATINQALKAIADLCDQGNYEGAKKNIHATLKSINSITDEKYSAELKPFIDDLLLYLDGLDQAIKNNK